MRVVNQKLRKAIKNEGRVARIEGLWWQFLGSLSDPSGSVSVSCEPSGDDSEPFFLSLSRRT
jgi:hypothetical protein